MVQRALFQTIRSFGIFTRSIILGFFLIIGLTGLGFVGFVVYTAVTLPNITEITQKGSAESSKIFAKDGTLLYEFHGEYRRTSVPLAEINDNLRFATIAIEDKDFYSHGAVSLEGMGRALLANSQSGKVSQGGSTLTQQFVKSAVLTRERSFRRKISEILLAYKLEQQFSKNQILELYLNEIPYGRNAYGAEAASQVFYGKSAKDLTLLESAYLAALPQAPSFYNPDGDNRDALDARAKRVLQAMKDQGYITAEQQQTALSQQIAFSTIKRSIIAPHFVAWVQNILTEQYGDKLLREGGLQVYTSLDLRLQKLAEDTVKVGVAKNGRKYGFNNGALVAVDPSTGQVLAMVGSKDYFGTPEPKGCVSGKNCKFEPQANVATSLRQPGSSFKPYAYVTAFGPEFKQTPMSKILDKPQAFGTNGGRPYIPQNYDGRSRGLVTIRTALAGSLNVPAVKITNLVGVQNVVKTAQDLGITSQLKNCGLSLVLGGCEVRLVDHTVAYGTIANLGKYNGNTPFIRIHDKRGEILYGYTPQEKQVIDAQAAYELISIMTDDPARQYVFGKNNPLTLPDRPVGCKTGTTQNWKDGWTMCFTPQLAVGVWVGNNDSSLMRRGADGVFTAAPIFNAFIKSALTGQPVQSWAPPAGIVTLKLDPSGTRLAPAGSRVFKLEPVASYAIPSQFKINTRRQR